LSYKLYDNVLLGREGGGGTPENLGSGDYLDLRLLLLLSLKKYIYMKGSIYTPYHTDTHKHTFLHVVHQWMQ